MARRWLNDVSRREMQRHSHRDADASVRFDRDIMRQCRFIRKFLLKTAPDPASFKPRDMIEMLYMGKELFKLGEDVIYDMMRFYNRNYTPQNCVVSIVGDIDKHEMLKPCRADRCLQFSRLRLSQVDACHECTECFTGRRDLHALIFACGRSSTKN